MRVDGEAKVFVGLTESRILEPLATFDRRSQRSSGKCKRVDSLRCPDVNSDQESLVSCLESFDACIAADGEVLESCSCSNAVEGRPRVES